MNSHEHADVDTAPGTTTLATALLTDAFTRVAEDLPRLLLGFSHKQLLWRPDPAANSVGWLTWHLTRVQDDHLAGVGQVEQVWLRQDWCQRFALPYPPQDIGYGQTAAEVAGFNVDDPELLLAYHRAVHLQTLTILSGLTQADYQRIVDERWQPPVTAAVRLVSVINDITAHTGQIGYLRGLIERRL